MNVDGKVSVTCDVCWLVGTRRPIREGAFSVTLQSGATSLQLVIVAALLSINNQGLGQR